MSPTCICEKSLASNSVRNEAWPPAGGGERFIATDRFLWIAQVAAILRERLGEAARKAPTRVAPNLLVRTMALFDGSLRSVVGDLGKESFISSQKARTMLGWTTRPVEDSIEVSVLTWNAMACESEIDDTNSPNPSAPTR